jgi:hypothetical protein
MTSEIDYLYPQIIKRSTKWKSTNAPAAMSMTRKKEILKTVSMQGLLLQIYLMNGYVRSVEQKKNTFTQQTKKYSPEFFRTLVVLKIQGNQTMLNTAKS